MASVSVKSIFLCEGGGAAAVPKRGGWGERTW